MSEGGYVRIDVGPVRCVVSLSRPFTADQFVALGPLTDAVHAAVAALATSTSPPRAGDLHPLEEEP